jgi:hypothetical protein
MNNKIEAELLKNLTNQNSLEDVLLMSSGSVEQINGILMKLLNKYHLHSARKPSTSCSIHRLIKAA